MSDIFNPSSGGGGGSGTLTSISPADASLIFTPNPITSTGTIGVNLGGAFTWTANGAASVSAVTYTGTPFAGTATTSTPLAYFNNAVTQPTTWSTAGTALGMNLASGFAGNFLDLHVNGGATVFSISASGSVQAASIAVSGNMQLGGASTLTYAARSRITSPADGSFTFTNNAVTGFTSLNLGPTVAAPTAVAITAAPVLTGTSNTAGANFTIAGSQGTGTGIGGNIIFQTAAAGTTGTSQNALSTSLTISPTGISTSTANNVGSILVGSVFGVATPGNGTVALDSGVRFGWSSTPPTLGSTTLDTIITRKAAASFQLGDADAASPVAQKLGVQNVVAGTSNTAGANFTIAGSQGTGTGIGGSVIIQVAPASGSGSTQNALATAVTIDSTKAAIFAGILRFNGTNTTGAGTALLGTNSPAITNTAPYTWIQVTTSDGSTAYIPAWK